MTELPWYRVFTYPRGDFRPDYAQLDDATLARARRLAEVMQVVGPDLYLWALEPVSESEVIIECQLLERGDIMSRSLLERILAEWEVTWP